MEKNNQYPYRLPLLIRKRMMDTIENILETFPASVSNEYLGTENLPWDEILYNSINLDISKAYLETVKRRLSPEYKTSQDLPWENILYNMNNRNKKSPMSMILRDRTGRLHKILYGHA